MYVKFLLIIFATLFSLFGVMYADDDPKVDYCVKAYTLSLENTGTSPIIVGISGDGSHRYHYEFTSTNTTQNDNTLEVNSGGAIDLSMYHHLWTKGNPEYIAGSIITANGILLVKSPGSEWLYQDSADAPPTTTYKYIFDDQHDNTFAIPDELFSQSLALNPETSGSVTITLESSPVNVGHDRCFPEDS